MIKIYDKFKQLLDLVVFQHSIFALPFLFASMMSAAKIEFGTIFFDIKTLILGIICAVSARNFAMAVNRLLDEDIDRLNPRTQSRPNISGKIGRASVVAFIILNALIFVLATYFINALAFYLSVPVLALLALYSTFKRFSFLAHIVLGLCLGLSAIAGCIIITGRVELFSVWLCLGVCFWTAGFDLLYSLQDMEFDKKAGLHSVPARFGARATLVLSALCHLIAVLFWLLFAWQMRLNLIGFAGILVCAAILVFEQIIVRRNFAQINRAFFTLNGYLSVVFMVFVAFGLSDWGVI